MIERSDDAGVALIRMCSAPANVLATEFADALSEELGRARDEDSVRAVVLTGTGSAFSAGVDLFRVLDGGASYVDALLASLNELFVGLWSFPKPLVAAVNGHAIAGGAVMLCACDYRVMADGNGKVGVPELKVGVPFPAIALRMVQSAVPLRYQREVLLLGANYTPEDARERGFIDEVVEADVVVSRAVEVANDLATIPPRTYAFSKRQLLRASDGGALAEMEGELRDIWCAPETHGHIRGYLDATLGRSSGKN